MRALASGMVLLSLFLQAGALAAPPEIPAGTCIYLAGAPAGAEPAPSESSFEGCFVQPTCLIPPVCSSRANGGNSVQLVYDPAVLGTTACLGRAWVGHEFVVAGAGSARSARIDVAGGLLGSVSNTSGDIEGEIRLELVVEEYDATRSDYEELTRATPYTVPLRGHSLWIDVRIAKAMEFIVIPGRAYRIRMELVAAPPLGGMTSIFLAPPQGLGAWYDSIEVCIEAPEPPVVVDPDPRIDVIAALDLEERIYRKECMPGVWLPAANGGLLEAARQLVADRLASAVASGDPGVNSRVAGMRLASADEDIANGQYQRACRNLADGLRALTTP